MDYMERPRIKQPTLGAVTVSGSGDLYVGLPRDIFDLAMGVLPHVDIIGCPECGSMAHAALLRDTFGGRPYLSSIWCCHGDCGMFNAFVSSPEAKLPEAFYEAIRKGLALGFGTDAQIS